MRAIIQRVTNASVVTMDEMILSAIGAGLVVWVGMSRSDKQADIDFIIKQILNYQIYDKDEHTQWARTVVDMDYEILCLSEVSLYATTKGRFKPLFHNAMDSETAKVFFSNFVNELKQSYKPNKVRRGRYGTGSLVNAQFVGPVFSIQSSKKAARDKPFSPLRSQTNKPKRQRYPGPLYAQYLRPTRTIPLGVGKYYGQHAYYEQYPYNQKPYGYNQEIIPQPNAQYPYSNQNLHDQQNDHQTQYHWQQNIEGHYESQPNVQEYYGVQPNSQGHYGRQLHPDNYGGQFIAQGHYGGQPNSPNNYDGQPNAQGHYGGQLHSPDNYGGQQIAQGHYGQQPNSPGNYGGQLRSPDNYGGQHIAQEHYGGHQSYIQYGQQTFTQGQYGGQPYPGQITSNQKYNKQTGNIIPESMQATTQQPVKK